MLATGDLCFLKTLLCVLGDWTFEGPHQHLRIHAAFPLFRAITPLVGGRMLADSTRVCKLELHGPRRTHCIGRVVLVACTLANWSSPCPGQNSCIRSETSSSAMLHTLFQGDLRLNCRRGGKGQETWLPCKNVGAIRVVLRCLGTAALEQLSWIREGSVFESLLCRLMPAQLEQSCGNVSEQFSDH